MKKKIFLIVIVIIAILWISGVIPMGIARICGTVNVKKYYPNEQLEYENIEWSKFHGKYIVCFRNQDNQTYTVEVGPRFFPIVSTGGELPAGNINSGKNNNFKYTIKEIALIKVIGRDTIFV